MTKTSEKFEFCRGIPQKKKKRQLKIQLNNPLQKCQGHQREGKFKKQSQTTKK